MNYKIAYLQLTCNMIMMILEYLEVLNLYNCSRWYCSGIPCGFLFINICNTIFFRDNLLINVPSLVCNFLGAGGLLFWDIEYWNVSTRHRTEYYDTHDSYFAMLYITNYFIIYQIYIRYQ